MGAHVLLPLAINSNAERKVNSLPPLGFEPASFGTQATPLGPLGQGPSPLLVRTKFWHAGDRGSILGQELLSLYAFGCTHAQRREHSCDEYVRYVKVLIQD
jgi:hypothetical protein